MSASCLVAMYHYVRPTSAGGLRLNALDPADFDRQLAALTLSRQPIDYDEFLAHVVSREGFASASTLLTFDDGFADHYEQVLPRLRQHQISGVFFLAGRPLLDPPRVLNVHKTHFLIAALGAGPFAEAVRHQLVDRAAVAPAGTRQHETYRYDAQSADADVKHLLNYELPFAVADDVLSTLFATHFGDEATFARTLYLSVEQIREMASAGLTFGYHTDNHRVLSRLSRQEQAAELGAGVEMVRRLTGQTSVPFCYPYGHVHTYNSDTIANLQQSGYALSFNTVRALVRSESVDPFEIPRFDTRDLPPFAPECPDA